MPAKTNSLYLHKAATRFLLFAAALYVFMVTGLFFAQRHMLFDATHIDPPLSQIGLRNASRVIIPTPDGEALVSYFHAAPAGRPTIIFLHGKGGEIAKAAQKLQFYADNGFGFLGLGYRGYGASTGTASEAGLVTDAIATHDWLTAKGVQPKQIMVLGESMGTGVAVQLAAKRTVGALALGAPYSSMTDVAARRYWFAPVRWLMRDPFDSVDHIKDVHVPVLIVHGTADNRVPYDLGQKLFEAADEPKTFVTREGEGHGMLFHREVWQNYVDFFERISATTTVNSLSVVGD